MVIKMYWIINAVAWILTVLCYKYKDEIGAWVAVLPFLLGYFSGLITPDKEEK